MYIRLGLVTRVTANAIGVVAISTLAACGGDDANGNTGSVGGIATPSPTSTASSVQYIATPVPFGLTQDQSFDIFGWDSWPSAPVPSVMQLRWNSSAKQYELAESGSSQFARLRLRADSDDTYDAFAPDGAKLSIFAVLRLSGFSSPGPDNLGNMRIFEGSTAKAYVAFGLTTAAENIPTSGIRTCGFGEDEIGGGEITFDFTSGTASGQIQPFWGSGGNPPSFMALTQVKYTPEEVPALVATFGNNSGNRVEALFYGPQASQIAVRANGEVSGVMTGTCSN